MNTVCSHPPTQNAKGVTVMRTSIKVLFALMFAASLASQAGAAELPDADRDYTYRGSDVELKDILTRFAENIGVTIVISEKVNARVDSPIGVVSRRDFLNALAVRYRFIWYFDGGVLYIASASEVETATIKMEKWVAHEIKRELKAAGLWEDRFIRAGDPQSQFLVVSAPRTFIETLTEVIKEIDKTDRRETKVIAVIKEKGQDGDFARAIQDASAAVNAEAPEMETE